MLNPNALMIDIETLGLGMRSTVTQVGIVAGNLETGHLFRPAQDFWMSVDMQRDRIIDFETVRWWMRQDQAVSAAVFNVPDGGPRTATGSLFSELKQIVDDFGCDVWASPAMFDLSMLTDLFGGQKPWAYNSERDMMTLYKWLDPKGELKPPANGMHHLASVDAQWQFNYLCALYKRVKQLT